MYLESKSSKPSNSFFTNFMSVCVVFKTILRRDTTAVMITSHKREGNRCINIFLVFITYLLNCYNPVASLMKSVWINYWFATPSSTKMQGGFAFSPYHYHFTYSLSFLSYVTNYRPLYVFALFFLVRADRIADCTGKQKDM